MSVLIWSGWYSAFMFLRYADDLGKSSTLMFMTDVLELFLKWWRRFYSTFRELRYQLKILVLQEGADAAGYQARTEGLALLRRRRCDAGVLRASHTGTWHPLGEGRQSKYIANISTVSDASCKPLHLHIPIE